ncbi:hypothetical protein ACFSOZ_37225, partial [Mesorhizobium newzealandense]
VAAVDRPLVLIFVLALCCSAIRSRTSPHADAGAAAHFLLLPASIMLSVFTCSRYRGNAGLGAGVGESCR